MGFFTVLSTGSHTFLHYHLRIPFVILSYSGLVFGNEAQLTREDDCKQQCDDVPEQLKASSAGDPMPNA